MPGLDDVLAMARTLSAEDRKRVAAALGDDTRVTLSQLGALANRPPAPHSIAWMKAERGHAVLATDTGPAESDIPAGADAIAGMWSDVQAAVAESDSAKGGPDAARG